MTRVVQWATGAVGGAQLRAVLDDPELELVGLFVYTPEKVGIDAGTLADRAPTGVVATNDKEEILALDADVVLHAASKGFAVNTNTDDIVALLASGKDVITTTSYNHLPTFGEDATARIEAACRNAGTRFHAAGEHPGFMFERLATSLTSLCHRVDRITVQEVVDCSGLTEPKMLMELMGMGKQPDEISVASPMFRAVSVQYEQALAAAAETLALEVDEVRHEIRTATVDHDVPVACGTLPAGSVVGQILSWSAYHQGRPMLVAEECWTCTAVSEWDLSADDQFAVRVRVEGQPNVDVELRIDRAPIAELGDVSGGHVAVAMTAVRAIPDVLAAPPGVVVPPAFGVYRFSPASRSG